MFNMQALKSGQWNLSDSEVSQLLMQLEVTPQGEFDYADWIAALIDWKDVQACDACQKVCVAASHACGKLDDVVHDHRLNPPAPVTCSAAMLLVSVSLHQTEEL